MRPSWLWVLVLAAVFVGVACDDDGGGAGHYEARVESAQTRATEATCACSWSERLRDQCLRYAGAGLEESCSAELAQRLASEASSYADCIAHTSELYARCLEQTDCDARSDSCRLDVRLDCGPVPVELDPALTVCLPRYRCQVGQEVSLERRCDGTYDCFDRSDEDGCED